MIRKKNLINIFLLVFTFLLASIQTAGGTDQPITVQAQVDKQEVTVGESFTAQERWPE
jgi:hypothetical protein